MLFRDPGKLGRHPDYVVASDSRLDDKLRAYLSSDFEVLARFEPQRLLPWVPVRGDYTMANPDIGVYRRRG